MTPNNDAPTAEKPTSFSTKDREEIICLLSHKHVPISIKPIRVSEREIIMMFEFPETAQKLYLDFLHQVPIPIKDIRDVFEAERNFKRFKQIYC